MTSQLRADASAAKPILPQLFETEKEVIMDAKATINGLALFGASEEMIVHLHDLGLVYPATNIGGYKRPTVLTNLGCKVFRHLNNLNK